MIHQMKLSEEDVLKAMELYFALKGYKLTGYQFNTRWSYDRVLFDVSVRSWFTGMQVEVQEAPDLKERIMKNLPQILTKF